MRTRLRCYGHLEKRNEETVWEAYPIDPMPSFSDWVLPANGVFSGARYSLSIEVADRRRDVDEYRRRYSSQVQLEGVVRDIDVQVLVPGVDDFETPEDLAATLGRNGLCEGDFGRRCWVVLTFEYEPGLTKLVNGITREELVERQRTSEYRTSPAELPFSRERPSDPEPERLPSALSKRFADHDIEIDYRGVVRTDGRELCLPMGIRHGIATDDGLVLLLDPKRGGVSNPDVTVPEDRNVVGIDDECEVRWRIGKPETHRFYHLWEKDGVILAGDSDRWYEIAPSTGAVTDSYSEYHGRFE